METSSSAYTAYTAYVKGTATELANIKQYIYIDPQSTLGRSLAGFTSFSVPDTEGPGSYIHFFRHRVTRISP
jgi:hypothetical protein